MITITEHKESHMTHTERIDELVINFTLLMEDLETDPSNFTEEEALFLNTLDAAVDTLIKD